MLQFLSSVRYFYPGGSIRHVFCSGIRFCCRLQKMEKLMLESVYRQRKPQNSPYYQCVEDRFETFEQVYEQRFGGSLDFTALCRSGDVAVPGTKMIINQTRNFLPVLSVSSTKRLYP